MLLRDEVFAVALVQLPLKNRVTKKKKKKKKKTPFPRSFTLSYQIILNMFPLLFSKKKKKKENKIHFERPESTRTKATVSHQLL